MEKKVPYKPPKTVKAAIAYGITEGEAMALAKQDLRLDIAHRVKSLRTEAKITQEEMAKRININALTYRGYENCRSDIPLYLLVRIANVLGVSLDYITGRTDVRHMASQDTESTIEQRLQELEKIVAGITK